MKPYLPSPKNDPRLSALIVNYDSGDFATSCVSSLRREWARSGRSPEQLEVIVVDNASPSDQRLPLGILAGDGARVLTSPRNLGYAGGIQAAFEQSSGGPDDYVAVLNPDVVFLEGSVDALLDYLELHPECGAIAPRAWVDEERCFHLPPVPLPSTWSEAGAALVQASPRVARWSARQRAGARLASWTASEPAQETMLSGACLFLHRGVADDLGQLLDPRYPLYYEDADLCRRLSALGLTLVFHPGAPILHHWSRSAGAGAAFEGEPRRRFEISRRTYREHHLSGAGRRLVRGAERYLQRRGAMQRGRVIHEHVSLGPCAQPPSLVLPGDGPLVLELSMTPLFELAAGALVEPGSWRFPSAAWSWLFEGTYFMRTLERSSLRLSGAWRFQKTSAVRTWPVEAA